MRGEGNIISGGRPIDDVKESVRECDPFNGEARCKVWRVGKGARVLLICLFLSAGRFGFAEASHPASAHGTTLSGQDALEKLVLREEQTLTNQLQSAEQKAQALGGSGVGFGTYMLILAGVMTGGVVLRKVLPVLAVPFLNDNGEPRQPAPVSNPSHAHEEAFSEFMEQFNARQKPAPAVSGSVSLRKAEEELQQLKLPLDPSMVAQGKIQQRVQSMRGIFSELSRGGDEEARSEGLGKLFAAVSGLTKELRLSETHPTAHMISAMEALVSQLSAKAQNRTASTLRTLASAIDLLPALCDPGIRGQLAKARPIRVMAADDDAVIRHALDTALKRVGAAADLAVDGEEGLKLAESNAYDLIFVDIEMPGIDGFELCCRIKNTPLNPLTPVVFVTSHNDLATRAKSSLAGGLEFLGKPFISAELAVKALALVLKRRLQADEQVGVNNSCSVTRSTGRKVAPDSKGVPGVLLEAATA